MPAHPPMQPEPMRNRYCAFDARRGCKMLCGWFANGGCIFHSIDARLESIAGELAKRNNQPAPEQIQKGSGCACNAGQF
jgi:hypothetical protein